MYKAVKEDQDTVLMYVTENGRLGHCPNVCHSEEMTRKFPIMCLTVKGWSLNFLYVPKSEGIIKHYPM